MRTEIKVIFIGELGSLKESVEKNILAGRRHSVDSAVDPAQAADLIRERRYDLCILGYNPKAAGLPVFLAEVAQGSLRGAAFVVVAEENLRAVQKAFENVKVDDLLNRLIDSEHAMLAQVEGLLLRVGSRILVVDEHSLERKRLVERVLEMGFADVVQADNGLDALLRLPTFQPDIVLIGPNNRDVSPVEFIKEVRKDDSDIRVLVLMDSQGITQSAELLRAGAGDCHSHRVSQSDLAKSIVRQVEMRNAALERKRLQTEIEQRDKEIQRELDLAAIVQRHMLPTKPPLFPGFKFRVLHYPSRQIGGDVYQFQRFGTGQLAVVFADIAGHGIPAALLSIVFRIYWELVIQETQVLKDILATLERRLDPIYPPGAFASTFALILDSSGTVRYVRASQEPGLLIRPSGEIEELTTEGPVLGFFPPDVADETWKEKEVTLQRGDKILLYTDGVTEAQNPDGDEYGNERLYSLLKSCASLSSDELGRKLVDDVCKYRTKDTFEDDLTILIIEKT